MWSRESRTSAPEAREPYREAGIRGTRLGVLVTALTVAIVVLMVWRPIWW